MFKFPLKYCLKKNQLFIVLVFAILLFIFCHTMVVNSYFKFSYVKDNQISAIDNLEELLVQFVLDNAQTISQAPMEALLSQFDHMASKAYGVNLRSTILSYPAYPQVVFLANDGVQPILNYLTQSDTAHISVKLSENVWFNLEECESDFPYIFIITLTLVEFFLVSIVVFYIFGIMRFSIPLQRFKKSTEYFGVQLKTSRVSSIGPKIVQEAANAMNQMQQRITELVERRTHMLATISHDLRTPITRLKIRAQCFDDETIAEQIIPDLDEMENMITTILEFTRDESQTEPMVKFDLNALFFVVCEEIICTEPSVQVFAEPQRVVFTGRRLALKRAFHNLLQNAIRYAQDVSASFQMLNDKVIITFADRGPGIAENELEKVFEAYYRGEVGKKYSSVGTGLGLASVQAIVRQHNGTVTLQNRENGGLIATIILPLS